MQESELRALLGIPELDLSVLSCLYDLGLVPPAWHRRTVDVLEALADGGLCGIEDGYRVLQRLAASWLMPLPLIDAHGNFGSMYDPCAPPMFNEVRLTPAGAMAVEAHRGELPLLPIGLINGTLPLVLGLDFGLWPDAAPDDPDRRHQPDVRFRPGFVPDRLAAALTLVAEPGAPRKRSDVTSLVGAPWLAPFETPLGPLGQLLETGAQTVRLTPLRNEHDDWTHPPADVVLDLGAPLRDVLWEWIASTGDRAPEAALLDQLATPASAP